MRYEQRLIWVLGITFGFLFFDRNAASYLMPFIIDGPAASTTSRSA